MKTFLTTALIILIPGFAYSGDFSGVWHGSGSVEFGNAASKLDLQCSKATMSFDHASDKIALTRCLLDDCKDSKGAASYIECEKAELKIDAGKLVYNGKQVGIISNNFFLVNIIDSGWVISATGTIKAETLNYIYHSSNPATQEFVNETAILKK